MLTLKAAFVVSAQLGSFFSGVMQGGIQNTMHNRNGFAGWKWLFIIDFAITVPVALYGYFMFPDTPHTTRAFWLTEEERQLCLSRLPPTEHYVITWPRFRQSCIKIVTTWRFYLFCALFMLSATSFEKVGVYSECLLWLKSIKYNPATLNYLGLTPLVTAITGTYAVTVWCDATGHRFWANVIMYVSVLISSIMILVWDISFGAKLFAYIIAGESWAFRPPILDRIRRKEEEKDGGLCEEDRYRGRVVRKGTCCHKMSPPRHVEVAPIAWRASLVAAGMRHAAGKGKGKGRYFGQG